MGYTPDGTLKNVTIWRLSEQRRIDDDSSCSGIGASYTPGRWNKIGESVIYTASSISLAFLEIYVHISLDRRSFGINEKNSSRRVVKIELDGLNYREISLNQLHNGWRREKVSKTRPTVLQLLGSKWLNSSSFPVLKVPSAIIPFEFNYIINPHHPDVDGRLSTNNIVDDSDRNGSVSAQVLPEPLEFDDRL